MQIIIYSETTSDSISSDLGKSEYSYYFILRAYLPALESLGRLVYVENPELEVDALSSQAMEAGESSVFLSFSPPHRTSTGYNCPTVCVLAWEFSSIPDRDLGRGEQDNWARTLEEVHNVLTISDYSTEVIVKQLGEKLHIATIPAPVTNKPVPGRGEFAVNDNPAGRRSFEISAEVIDSWSLEIHDDVVYPRSDRSGGIDERDVPVWDGRILKFHFDGYSRENNGSRQLVGFHTPETWGAWARSDKPWINLPVRMFGEFTLKIDLIAFGDNVNRPINITIGSQTHTVEVDAELRTHEIHFSNVDGGTYLAFSNLLTCYTIGADLLRALSVGVGDMSIELSDAVSLTDMPRDPEDKTPVSSVKTLDFSGLIYTSIFNPEDGRKNWEDILKAFCWAFREDEEATLILKLSCPSMTATWGKLLTLLSQLNPFACRVVIIHGYLSDGEMARLVEITDFIVNASHAEGQCLPLLEFMAEGVPAIAPDHTAMGSYINSENAFVVDSWRAATCWPQDEREIKRTFFYNVDWASLLKCFENSANVLRHDKEKYTEMGYQAMCLVRQRFSLANCEKQLSAYFQDISNGDENR